ncbi:MAG: DUF167 domain-containing protein [Candidatus Paceibacterota bacterium]
MYIKVKVIPKAKKETVKEIRNNVYEVSVKEPAERNLANNRIRELLAGIYKVNEKAVRIVSGHHSGNKIFNIEDNLIA